MSEANSIEIEMRMRLVKTLKCILLFYGLEDHVLLQLTQHMEAQYIQNDHIIFNKGDIADALYIIQSGKVLIYQPDTCQGIGERLAILGENSFFGEMGLVSQQPRNASARTLEDTLLIVLTKEAFTALLNENAEVASAIMEIYTSRNKMNQKREFLHTQNSKKKPSWEDILIRLMAENQENP